MTSPRSRTSRHSLSSLSHRLSGIYNNYATKANRDVDDLDAESASSLDSAANEPAAPLHTFRALAGNPPPSHAFNVQTPSRAGTPTTDSLFDFTVNANDNYATNSSLNVLLDTESKDQFVSETSLDDSGPSLDPLARRNGRAAATNDSLGSYRDYEENLAEDWADRGAAVATSTTPKGTTVIRRAVEDFEFGKDLGEGSYSTVVLAKDKLTGVKYAVKILDKRHIIKEKKVKYVNIEKHALNRLSQAPGMISLYFTFQDRGSLYYVLEYASNGELLGLIKKYGTLNEECTRYLGAQILDAIKHMHEHGVIHRDIKPENILLDDKCRIRITDFGTAKLLERRKNDDTGAEEDYPLDVRAKSFVGTAEYVSPELLENKYCGKPGDWWAFGCILYQMVAGKPPFKATNEYLTFQKITKLQYAFSAGFPSILRDLLKQILVLQPSRRAKVDQIQDHFFFRECNFDDYDLIWNSDIPELSPYKMTAKSMMKMPASEAKRLVIPKVVKKPQALNGTAKRHEAEAPTKDFSPASVAAYVLHKDEPAPEPKPKTPKPASKPTPTPKSTSTPKSKPKKSSTPSHSSADYIPGTNILRPQINKIPTYSVASSVASSKSDRELRRNSSKVMEVTPVTAVEAAWLLYLSPSERIIHVGLATVRRQPTEVFEKKNKGAILDTPLGFTNKLQAISNRSNSRSMLSHVVQGNRLRDVQDTTLKSQYYDEDDAITYHYEEVSPETDSVQEDDDDSSPPVSTSSGKLGKSFFKKLLISSDKKSEANNNTSGASAEAVERKQIDLLEKARGYTVMITTFGRVLLFLRDDHKANYKLVCEVALNFPFIQFKEVVTTSSGKFGKMIPATGIFAIVALKVTFVFETEKYEVSLWTDALAKSKLNQFEREVEAEQKAEQKASENQSPVTTPKMLSSPAFVRPSPGSVKTPDTPLASPRVSQPSASNSPRELRGEEAAKKTGKVRLRRKVPLSLPTTPILASNGFSHSQDHGGSEYLHAAQIAVLNSPAKSQVDSRRSSFSRDKNGLGLSPAPAAGNGGGKITTMNSKFLARSRARK